MRWLMLVALGACGGNLIPLTPKEQCAEDGMIAAGLSISEGEARGTASSGGIFARSRAVSYGRDVSCQRPVTTEDRCEEQAASATAAIKRAYNPGIFGDSESDTRENVRATYISTWNFCMGISPTCGPPTCTTVSGAPGEGDAPAWQCNFAGECSRDECDKCKATTIAYCRKNARDRCWDSLNGCRADDNTRMFTHTCVETR